MWKAKEQWTLDPGPLWDTALSFSSRKIQGIKVRKIAVSESQVASKPEVCAVLLQLREKGSNEWEWKQEAANQK
jgi:hypothetical protein